MSGIAFNPDAQEIRILTDKYQMIAPMTKKIKFILSHNSIKDQIQPYSKHYTYQELWLVAKYSNDRGMLFDKPVLGRFAITMCFKNKLNNTEVENYQNMLKDHKMQSLRVYHRL